MTKQDYIALEEAIQAAIIRMDEEPPGVQSPLIFLAGVGRATRYVAEEIASVLARDNSRFDRERFLAAALRGEWSNAPGHNNRQTRRLRSNADGTTEDITK